MPTAKKTKAKTTAKPSPKNDPLPAVLNVLKIIGKGIIDFFKFILDFIIKLLHATLKFVPLTIASIAILIVCLALSVYLLSATVGLKNNPDWQEYLSGKVNLMIQMEKEAANRIEEVVEGDEEK